MRRITPLILVLVLLAGCSAAGGYAEVGDPRETPVPYSFDPDAFAANMQGLIDYARAVMTPYPASTPLQATVAPSISASVSPSSRRRVARRDPSMPPPTQGMADTIIVTPVPLPTISPTISMGMPTDTPAQEIVFGFASVPGVVHETDYVVAPGPSPMPPASATPDPSVTPSPMPSDTPRISNGRTQTPYPSGFTPWPSPWETWTPLPYSPTPSPTDGNTDGPGLQTPTRQPTPGPTPTPYQ